MTARPRPRFLTFIAFLLQSRTGAGLATLGIFGTAFLMLASSGYRMPRLESRSGVLHGLPGVNAAAMGLMVHVRFDLV
jgi:hypothetical protein